LHAESATTSSFVCGARTIGISLSVESALTALAPPKGRKAAQRPHQKTPDTPPAGGAADEPQERALVRWADNGDQIPDAQEITEWIQHSPKSAIRPAAQRRGRQRLEHTSAGVGRLEPPEYRTHRPAAAIGHVADVFG